MSKRILFDIDGVLADFILGFTTKAHELFGKEIHTTPKHQKWDFPDYSKSELDTLWENIKLDGMFWYFLSPLVEYLTFNRIRGIMHKNEVYFVTNRPGINSKYQTETWLQYFLEVPATVVVASRKGEFAKAIDADFSIEDKAENAWCIAWLSPNTKSYLLDRAFYRYDDTRIGSSKVIRVYSVDEYLDVIGGELDSQGNS